MTFAAPYCFQLSRGNLLCQFIRFQRFRRVGFLFIESLRAAQIVGGLFKTSFGLDLKLRQAAALGIHAGIFNVKLRSRRLNLRGFRCGRSLNESRQGLSLGHPLPDARYVSTANDSANRSRNNGAFRWNGNHTSRGLDLRRPRCFFCFGEFHVNEPLLFHQKRDASCARGSRGGGRLFVACGFLIKINTCGGQAYDNDEPGEPQRVCPGVLHGWISLPTASSSAIMLA
jgi:hypothetical protein